MQIIHGDCLEVLRSLPEHSVDAIISDPPAGIAFMGKDWDNFSARKKSNSQEEKSQSERDGKWLDGRGTSPYGFSHGSMATRAERDTFISFLTEVFTEARRVIRPGGHAFIWALPRTSHWTALALEDAGWEIRDRVEHVLGSDTLTQNFLASLNEEQRTALDMLLESEQSSTISHIFGSGFPKSHNISVAIDKHLKVEREVIGERYNKGRATPIHQGGFNTSSKYDLITTPATPLAQQYSGFGTALKPAHEVWWLCRAPLAEKSIAENVLRWGTGGLNIDGTRVAGEGWTFTHTEKTSRSSGILGKPSDARTGIAESHTAGRWPSNFLLSHSLFCTEDQCIDDCPVAVLDRQSGIRKSGGGIKAKGGHSIGMLRGEDAYHFRHDGTPYQASEGGASRYFQTFYYCPKPSKRERSAGCDELPEVETIRYSSQGQGLEAQQTPRVARPERNHHPTVKPTQLMQYLCRLITPLGGTVLDPFAGSGTTGVACIQEGFDFIGVEREPEYIEIARARIEHAQKLHAEK